MANTLAFGALPRGTAHLCVDMQNVFLEATEWNVPWMKIILPAVTTLAARRPQDTAFSRFCPSGAPHSVPGAWQRYYARWPQYTVDAASSPLLDLAPPLKALCPPAAVFDKAVYSAFASAGLHDWLSSRATECLVITGVETDVCVLATILGAVDRGYRVVVPVDGVCSSTDTGHDSLLQQYQRRFSQQIEVTDIPTLLSCWD